MSKWFMLALLATGCGAHPSKALPPAPSTPGLITFYYGDLVCYQYAGVVGTYCFKRFL